MIFAQGPKHPFAICIIGFGGKLLFQTLDLLFSQVIKILSIVLGKMKSVNDRRGGHIIMLIDKFINRIDETFPHIGGAIVDGGA